MGRKAVEGTDTCILGSPIPSSGSSDSTLTPPPDSPEPGSPDPLLLIGRDDWKYGSLERDAEKQDRAVERDEGQVVYSGSGRKIKKRRVYDPSDEVTGEQSLRAEKGKDGKGQNGEGKGKERHRQPAVIDEALYRDEERHLDYDSIDHCDATTSRKSTLAYILGPTTVEEPIQNDTQPCPSIQRIPKTKRKDGSESRTSAPNVGTIKGKRKVPNYRVSVVSKALCDSMLSFEEMEGGYPTSHHSPHDHLETADQPSANISIQKKHKPNDLQSVKRRKIEKKEKPSTAPAHQVITGGRVQIKPGYIPSRKACKVFRLFLGISPRRSSPSTSSTTSTWSSKRSKVIYQGPLSKPPVWAETRQELCEALPYYRAFQSGLYMSSRVAYGYLLEAFPAPRDVWAQNGRIVISHGIDKTLAVLQADQSDKDARIDTLLHAYHKRAPLVLLAGDGYGSLPFALNRAYVVLGWYWISHIWVEAEPAGRGVKMVEGRDYFHRYKVRFDWIESQGRPWWDTFGCCNLPCQAEDNEPDAMGLDIPPLSSTKEQAVVSSHLVGQGGLLTPPDTPEKADPTLAAKLTSPDTIEQLVNPLTVDAAQRPLIIASSDSLNMSSFQHISCCCPTCNENSPRIYQEGWICLKVECSQFWLLDTGDGLLPIPPGFSLTYTKDWLTSVPTPRHLWNVPYNIHPPPPTNEMSEVETCAGDRTLWRGWACSNCGRANCRYRWEVWECLGCGKTYGQLDPAKVISIESLVSEDLPFMGDAEIAPDSGIRSEATMLVHGIMMVYTLPGRTGRRIYHVMPFDKTFASVIWEGYQLEAAGARKSLFQRRALANGQMLAQHFAVNSGADYKYNVDSLSVSFEESPACIQEARQMICSAVALALGYPVDFNEVLSVLYREGQKMNWHDDGEVGLGPVVASLSLGSDAVMSWRPKINRYKPNSGFYNRQEGKQKYHQSSTALSITLSHGDIVIMEGEDIQLRYSHRVVPLGFRVAATARRID